MVLCLDSCEVIILYNDHIKTRPDKIDKTTLRPDIVSSVPLLTETFGVSDILEKYALFDTEIPKRNARTTATVM